MGYFAHAAGVEMLAPGPTDDFWYSPIGRTVSSGIKVDETTSLNYSACWAARCVLSEAVASLPCSLMENVGPNRKEVAVKHHLYSIVHDEPTREQDSMLWFDQQLGLQIDWGNAYAEIDTNRLGQVVNLWPIHPSRIPDGNITRNPTDTSEDGQVGKPGELVYRVNNNMGAPTYLPASRVLHIPGRHCDNGITGKGVVRYAAETIGLGIATERFGASFFSRGATPRIVLKHPGRVSPKAQETLQKTWAGGLANAHETLITEEGMEIEKLTIEPEAAQFLQTREFGIEEIARWYRVPPHMLAKLDRAIQANIESESLSLVLYSLMPWIKRWERGMNRQLLTPAEKKRFYFKFNVNGLLRGDMKTRAEFYQLLFYTGVFSPNDIRALEDQNPVEGGDTRFVQVNMMPLDKAKDFDPNAPARQQQRNAARLKRLRSMMLDLTADAAERDNMAQQASVQLDLKADAERAAIKADLMGFGDRLGGIQKNQSEALQAAAEAEKLFRDAAETREQSKQAARDMLTAAVKRVVRKHAQAARRESQKPETFLTWNDSFAETNRQVLMSEVGAVADICVTLGIDVDAEQLVSSHLDGARNELLEVSGMPRDQFPDAVESCVLGWEESRADYFVNKAFGDDSDE
jgi:HK97 family phage portal protein